MILLITLGPIILMALVCIALRRRFMSQGASDALDDLAIEHNARPETVQNRLEHRALQIRINRDPFN